MAAKWVGELALVSIAAIFLGYLVSRMWPKTLNPQLFTFLVPFAAVAGLAYTGSTAAAGALALIALVAVLALMVGVAG